MGVLASPLIGIRSCRIGNVWSGYAGFVEGVARMGHGLPFFPFLTNFLHLPIRSHQGEQTEMPVLRVVPGRLVIMLTYAAGRRLPGEGFKEKQENAKAYSQLQCPCSFNRSCRFRHRLVGQDRQGYTSESFAADQTRARRWKPAPGSGGRRTQRPAKIHLPTTAPCRRHRPTTTIRIWRGELRTWRSSWPITPRRPRAAKTQAASKPLIAPSGRIQMDVANFTPKRRQ